MQTRERRHFESAWERFQDPASEHTVEDLLSNALDDDPAVALGGVGLLQRWLADRERDLVPQALAMGATWFDIARWLGRSQEDVRREYGLRGVAMTKGADRDGPALKLIAMTDELRSCGPGLGELQPPPLDMELWPLASLGVGVVLTVLKMWNGLLRGVSGSVAVPELE